MGKQGPCCHCGVSSTPLWRNGPAEKPVLCNACGSRWRTKGSLANYTPLHARLDPDEYEEHRVTRVKTISLKRRDGNLNKRKLNYDNTVHVVHTPEYSQTFRKNPDEDTSNRSSSGSAISNSESYAQFGSTDASDMTGPAQSVVWDSLVPSKKRSCVARPKQSSVEKLTKDLHTILHEQASYFSEEELLFESGTPMGSVEFENGSVLIRHPNSIAREEESEASSLSVDNKFFRAEESYATPASLLLVNNSKTFGEQAKRHKPDNEQLPILWNHNSSLHQINLTDIVNSDVFRDNLTTNEQKHLLDYLPSVDTSTLSDSLRCVFANRHFTENLSSFQQLLAEGVFDSSYAGVKTEDCEVLKRYALSNLTKCKWVECYTTIKDKTAKDCTRECVNLPGDKSRSSGNVVITKKFQDHGNRIFPEAKPTQKIPPKRVLIKGGKGNKEAIQNKGLCFIPTPRNPFALHANGSSFMLDSLQLEDLNSDDQDVLLDIPSNGSFAQAELLHPSSIHPALIPPL